VVNPVSSDDADDSGRHVLSSRPGGG